MKAELITYLANAHAELKKFNGRSDARINLFFEKRYYELAKKFPHKPFSVDQSTFDFFLITLEYLSGERSLDEIPKSEYSQNYRKWIESFL